MEGKLVFSGLTQSNKPLEICYVKTDDVLTMLEYINTLSLEKTYITLQGEQLTLEDEQSYVAKQIENSNNNSGLLLLAFVDSSLAGICGLSMQTKTEQHVSTIHLSVAKEFRRDGIATTLMEQVMNEAKTNIKRLEIITLTAYAQNIPAINLYKKLGFIEFGKLPNGISRHNTYDDEVYMYKSIREI
jgi:RimJ/RimL family protein N-acetyltransferase